MLKRLSETVQATRRIARREKRRIGLGIIPSVLYGYMPGLIRQLHELDPNVELGLLEMMTLEQFDALKSGRIDIGTGRMPLEDPAIERLVVWEERLIAAMPREHPLAVNDALTASQIPSELLILYPVRPRPSYADHVLDIFRRSGIIPDRVMDVNQLETALGLVAAGIGLTIVPETVRGLFQGKV